MRELRANAREALDTIIFEVETPMNGRSIEEGRERELQAAKESVDYMRSVLNIGGSVVGSHRGPLPVVPVVFASSAEVLPRRPAPE